MYNAYANMKRSYWIFTPLHGAKIHFKKVMNWMIKGVLGLTLKV